MMQHFVSSAVAALGISKAAYPQTTTSFFHKKPSFDFTYIPRPGIGELSLTRSLSEIYSQLLFDTSPLGKASTKEFVSSLEKFPVLSFYAGEWMDEYCAEKSFSFLFVKVR